MMRARSTAGAQHDAPLPAPLFTSFEQYKPLERVLDTFEQTFRPLLEANNIQWLAMDAETRKQVVFQVFKQIPVLWIWDNIEPVNGFPASRRNNANSKPSCTLWARRPGPNSC